MFEPLGWLKNGRPNKPLNNMFRRLFPILIFVIVVGGVYAWLDREAIMEKVFDSDEVGVPERSFEEFVAEEEEEVSEPSVKLMRQEGGLVGGSLDYDPSQETTTTTEVVEEVSMDQVNESVLEDELNLAVPWTPQAPYAEWDEIHDDTCEEASVFMVAMYYEGEPSGLVDPSIADFVMLAMVEKQEKIFGYWKDTNAEKTGELAQSYYEYDYELVSNPTVDDIKAILSQGYPVIVPLAGQHLGNPYYTPPGPDYHMLVVRGYTDEGFITNDPGTKRGENFVYDYNTFMNAIHDWHPDDILAGEPVVLVLYP